MPLPQSWRDDAFSSRHAVLLESALSSASHARSLLFQNPVRHLTLSLRDASPVAFAQFFAELEGALALNLHIAGYFSYEFGAALLGIPCRSSATPLAHVCAYPPPRVFDHMGQTSSEPRDSFQQLDLALIPEDLHGDYLDRVAAVQRYIATGDTYQVNLTTSLRSATTNTPLQIYTALTLKQPSGYTAVLTLDPDCTLLSFSPELFFRTTSAGVIETRPMKGTAARGLTPQHDRALAASLPLDEKNRAEHVMIVDLLRNDLGRVCCAGSVKVHDLFAVESYPTVHQMVTTVGGQLQPNLRWETILRALFPCGSITGAPKHRTMQIIHQLESRARGAYTGAIGYIAPDGSSTFSVAIRTLALQHATPNVAASITLGVGGGIVADSVPADEYKECLLKARFVRQASSPFQLVETMRCHHGHIPLLARHLLRLRNSAAALGFHYDEQAICAALAADRHVSTPQRIRLTLAEDGSPTLTATDLVPWPQALRISMACTRTDAADLSLRHKTTARRLYDNELTRARLEGLDEVVFCNTDGQLTEGCITTLFLVRDGRLFTPPLTSGVLPGVLRSLLLESDLASEADVVPADLGTADAVLLGNSVRGLCPIASLLSKDGCLQQFPIFAARTIRDTVELLLR